LLNYELTKCGLKLLRQSPIPVIYEDKKIELGFRVDLIVENKVIIEIKSVETIIPVHQKQLLTYLKITGLKLGLLINFNQTLIKTGIHRIVNNL
jgi:GxxExxY protein